jgi:hypothetical protein
VIREPPPRKGAAAANANYGMLLATLLNVPAIFGPSTLKAATRTSAIRAAIKPYSIAVAPDSSLVNRLIKADIVDPIRSRNIATRDIISHVTLNPR